MNPLNFYLIYLGTLLLPALIGLLIRKRIDPKFIPLVVFFWLVLVWEVLPVFLSETSFLSILFVNTQNLLESLALIWIAQRWKLFEKKPATYMALTVLVILLWSADKFINGLNENFSWANVILSVLNAGLAALFLSRTLYTSSLPFTRNPVYLFAAGLLFHFLLAAMMEGGVLIVRPTGPWMAESLFYAGLCIGIISNLIYLKTILCISKTARFSYS